MGCFFGKAKEVGPEIHPKRIGVDSDIPCPSYWQERDITKEGFRKCVKCEKEEPDELAALQELMDNTLMPEPGQQPRRFQIEFAMRVEDWNMWDEYRRSISYISSIRGDEANGLNSDGVLSTTKSGTVETIPLTTRTLPKAFLDRLNPECNETYLWHATARKAAEKIVEDDFSTGHSGEANGQVLGRGVYLAESPSLSDQYAVKGPQGRYCMLLVRAVLGKVHSTRRFSRWRGKKLVMTTFTTKMVKKGECDSVLGDRTRQNRKGVREYCVANNTQLYPEYLILYNRIDLDTSSAKVHPEPES
jgi:hypothetical protein